MCYSFIQKRLGEFYLCIKIACRITAIHKIGISIEDKRFDWTYWTLGPGRQSVKYVLYSCEFLITLTHYFHSLYGYLYPGTSPRSSSLRLPPFPLSDTCTLSTICCVPGISNSMTYPLCYHISIAFPCPHTINDTACPHKSNFSSLQLLVCDGLVVCNLCSFGNSIYVHFDPLIHSNLCYYQYLQLTMLSTIGYCTTQCVLGLNILVL